MIMLLYCNYYSILFYYYILFILLPKCLTPSEIILNNVGNSGHVCLFLDEEEIFTRKPDASFSSMCLFAYLLIYLFNSKTF